MNETTRSENSQNVDDLNLLHEQTRLLYGALPLSLVVTLINSVLLVLVQWEILDRTILLSWLAFAVLVMLGRLVLLSLYRRKKPDHDSSGRWLLHFNVGAMFSGLTWMLAVIYLFPGHSLEHQVFLAFVIGGMCAGAVTSLSFDVFPIRVFLLFTLVPLIVQFMLGGTKISIAMGAMVLLFLASLWVSSSRMYQSTLQNIRLRFESDLREKEMSESEARYRLILDSAPVGIVHFDRLGDIVAVNRTFAEIVGKSVQEILGFNLLENVLSLAISHEVKESLSGRDGNYTGFSSDILGRRATPVRAYMRGITTDKGDIIGGVGIVEDISEDLRLDRMKSEFISTVSHELRTPLTSIRGSLGLIVGDMKEEVSPSILALLEIANRNSERLLLLINDILDISRIESGKLEMHPESIEVQPFVYRVLEDNESYGLQYAVGFRVLREEPDLFIQGDRNRLMQVFNNLLSNAAKFSGKGRMVDISFFETHGRVRFEVSDHGQGIPEEFRPHVFEKFAQYDASDTRSAGGTGLGLSISRGIVEQHRGTIGFSSIEGLGTTFYVELPLVEKQG